MAQFARRGQVRALLAAFLALSLLHSIPTAVRAQNAVVTLAPDRQVYGLADKTSVTITIDNQEQRPIGPLRIVVRLFDRGGRIIAFKNLYPGRQAPGQRSYSVTLNTDRLRLTGGAYRLEAIVFERSRQVAGQSRTILYAKSVRPVRVTPVLELDAPFAMTSDGVFTAETLLDEARPGSRTMQLLDRMASGKIPGLIIVTSSFLYQIDRASRGYAVETEAGRVERAADSEQARLASAMIDALRRAAAAPAVAVAFAPLGDANPVELRAAGLQETARELVTRGQELATDVLDMASAPSLAYLPHGGIDAGSLRFLADMGFAVVYDATSASARPVLSENSTVYPVVSMPASGTADTQADAVFFGLVSSQLDSPKERSCLLRVNELDPVALDHLAERSTTNGPFRFVPVGETVPEPGEAPTQRSDYGLFEKLVNDLLQRFKRSARLLAAYESSVVDERATIDRLEEELVIALLPALSPSQDFNGSFRRYHNLEARVKRSFASISLEEARIDFPTRSGKLPMTIKKAGSSVFKVIVKLRGRGIVFQRNEIPVTLSASTNVFSVPVRVNATGRIPVTMEIFTPNGYRITSSRLIVNSTFAYRLYSALLVVVALLAVLFLARRKIRARRTAA